MLQNPEEVFIFVNQNMDVELKDAFLTAIIEYILQAFKIKKADMKAAIEKLPDVENDFVSTWDMLLAEGEEKGLEKGLEQGIEQGIEQGKAIADLKKEVKFILALLKKFPQLSNSDIIEISESELKLVKYLKEKVYQKSRKVALKNMLLLFEKFPNLTEKDKEELELLAKKYGKKSKK